MYRLHGLSHEYACEICGNQSYRGRRAFERHFTGSDINMVCVVWVFRTHNIFQMEVRKNFERGNRDTKTVWNEQRRVVNSDDVLSEMHVIYSSGLL